MITTSRIVSLSFLFIGVFLLAQVILPIISFKFLEIGQKYSHTALISPFGKRDSDVLGISVKTDDSFSYFVSSALRASQPTYDSFNISIPDLRIDHAKVLVDSNDISRTLAHLPGSALPGEKGNVFISGHSAVTPILSFQNALFAKLPDAKKGDQVIIEAGGTKFTYQIIDKKVVDPSDTAVISPLDPMGRYISLMTCVPPGLNYKRLVVIGKII